MPQSLSDPIEHIDSQSDPASAATLTRHEALFAVQGMWCSSCAFAVEHFLKRQPGVVHASVNFVTATAYVQWSPDATDPDTLSSRVGKLGYVLTSRASPEANRARLARNKRALVTRLVVSIAFGMWTVMASALLYFNYGLDASVAWAIALVATVLALPVVGYAGLPFYRAAWRTLRAGRPGMDVLVSLGVLSAMAFSVWQLWIGSADVYVDTAVMLITLLLVGRLLEMSSRQDGLEALSTLDRLTPDTSVTWRQDARVRVAIDEVRVGDRVVVDEGETVPFDGRLEDSRALIDRAVLTGEGTPVTLTRGDRLEAGCINAGPAICLHVDAALGKRYIDTLRNRTLELHARKGEFQKVSDTFARWLPTVALGLALATFVMVLLRGFAIDESFAWALSVLVVACPCAVGLAIPVVTQAASARGLRQGIVFKDLAAFETLAKARSVAFDKTGTLTNGRLDIREIRTAQHVDGDDVLRIAAQAEQEIIHPVAQALRRHAVERGLTLPDATATTHHPGRGIEMHLPRRAMIRVGALQWLKDNGIIIPSKAELPGKLVGVSQGTCWLGTLAFAEPLAEGSIEAIQRFRQEAFTLALLSGDQASNVQAIGRQAGFRKEELFAELTPDAKARLADTLPRPSIFVGDGINDTLALASATTGISVAGATQQARDIATVSLLAPGIQKVWESHQLARSAYRLMRQNLGFSIAYNLLALGIAVWMPIPPVIAATAMTISSLSVLANAARLYIPPETESAESREQGEKELDKAAS